MTFLPVFSLFLIVGFSFFVQHVVLANDDPPRFVYRADFRGPDDVFQNGMSSLGENTNLIDHVDGRSCNYHDANSAFIATTSEERGARHWASEQLRTNEEQSFIYIYRIRASSNFFSMYDSLMHVFRQSNPRDERYRQRADRYRFLFEWVALQNIPANQIQSATRYRRDAENRGIEAEGQPQQNRRYQSRSTQGNNNPYDAGAINSDDVYAVPSNYSGLLTSCFAFCTRSDSQRRTTDPDTCPVPPVIFKTSLSAKTSTVWDPILRRTVQHVVPWEDHRSQCGDHVIERPRDCFVDPGTRDDQALLQVSCPQNDFYDKFVVLLRAGGSWYTWVDQSYTDIPTNDTWTRWSREIPVVDTNYNLADYDFIIQEVFYCGDRWWSELKVIPIYPLYHDIQQSKNSEMRILVARDKTLPRLSSLSSLLKQKKSDT